MTYKRMMISVLIAVFSYGCGGGITSRAPVSLVKEHYTIGEAESTPAESAAFMSYVVLGAGDVINIIFQFTPELNTTQMIRPDGKISLQYIGEVTAAGKTPVEFHDELVSLFSTQLRNPELSITIESLYSNRIFVGGAVATPGIIEPNGKITTLESIIQSGGFDLETASLDNVVVIRYQEGYRTGYQLDMRPAVKGIPHLPFYLEPFDIVYVPQQKIVGINRWVAYYLNNTIPQIVTSTLVSYLLLDYIQD